MAKQVNLSDYGNISKVGGKIVVPPRVREEPNKRAGLLAQTLIQQGVDPDALLEKLREEKEKKEKEKLKQKILKNKQNVQGVHGMSYEELMKLPPTKEAQEDLRNRYKWNENFDTEFPPAPGTTARKIWEEENQRRIDEADPKRLAELKEQARFEADIPSEDQAGKTPLSNLSTQEFDPDSIIPQGQILNYREMTPPLEYTEEDSFDRSKSGQDPLTAKDRMMKLRDRFSKDTQQAYDIAKIKEEGMADYIKMMQEDKRAEDARRFPYRDDFYTPPEKTEKQATDEMGMAEAAVQRESDQERRQRLSDYNTKRSQEPETTSGMKEFLEKQPTSKQYEQRIKSQVELSEAVDKVQEQMAVERVAKDEEAAQVQAEEALYNKSMTGGLGDPNIAREIKRVEEEELELEEAIEEYIPLGNDTIEDRKDVKRKAGNFMDHKGYLINLDAVAARTKTLEDREIMFKTAQLLKGKPLEKFLLRNKLISKNDIPVLTETEKNTLEQEKRIKNFESEEKLANLLSRRVVKDGKVTYLKKGDKKGLSEKDVITEAMDIYKESPELAYALLKKYDIEMPQGLFKTTKGKIKANISKLGDISQWVGSNDPKATEQFMSKYFDRRDKVISELADIFLPDAFTSGSNKAAGYFQAVGIEADSWDKMTVQEKKNGIELFNPNSKVRYKILPPKGGFKNANEFYTAAHKYAFDHAMGGSRGGFHRRYKKVFGEDVVNKVDPGKTDGDGSITETDITYSDTNRSEGLLSSEENISNTQRPLETNIQAPLETTAQVPLETNTGKIAPSLTQIDSGERFENMQKIGSGSQLDEHLKRMERISKGAGGGGGKDTSGMAFAVEPGPPISETISNMGLGEVFTYGQFIDGRRGAENARAYMRTMDNEGNFVPKYRQEFFEKQKGKPREPVLSNGKPVYHIGYGIRLPLKSNEARLLVLNGMDKNKAKSLTLNPNNKGVKNKLEKIKITEDQADKLSQFRYANHIKTLIKKNPQVDWVNLPEKVRTVLFDMAYNLGPEFMTRKKDPFDDFRRGLGNKKEKIPFNVITLINEIEDSDYYRKQVGNRAQKNIDTLSKLSN